MPVFLNTQPKTTTTCFCSITVRTQTKQQKKEQALNFSNLLQSNKQKSREKEERHTKKKQHRNGMKTHKSQQKTIIKSANFIHHLSSTTSFSALNTAGIQRRQCWIHNQVINTSILVCINTFNHTHIIIIYTSILPISHLFELCIPFLLHKNMHTPLSRTKAWHALCLALLTYMYILVSIY